MTEIMIVRFAELTMKDKNKINFINKLKANIQKSCSNFPNLNFNAKFDYIKISRFTEAEKEPLTTIIKRIFGISNFSFVKEFPVDLTNLSNEISQFFPDTDKMTTFKLVVSRSDKNFPMSSLEVTKKLATVVLKKSNYKVDVVNPEITLYVQVKKGKILCFNNKIAGAGGLPVGSSGRVLLLLSGGIDSPVAAYELMKRGVEVIYLHFATPPITTPEVLQKIKDLVHTLAPYNNHSESIYLCNFLPLQNELMHTKLQSYRITLMRRMFIRIANKLATKLNISALATGDALGQVASQTLESLHVMNHVSFVPILRPLITQNKQDIIDEAKKIKTYNISIRPFEDCCSLFVPEKPIIYPVLGVAEDLEKTLNELVNIDDLINNLVQEMTNL